MDRDLAEQEVLGLLRGEEDEEFTLTISRRGDHWVVGVTTSKVPGPPGQGDGANFAEAWHRIKSYWAD